MILTRPLIVFKNTQVWVYSEELENKSEWGQFSEDFLNFIKLLKLIFLCIIWGVKLFS